MFGGRGPAEGGYSTRRGLTQWLLALGCLLISCPVAAGGEKIATLRFAGNAVIPTAQIIKGFSTHAGGILDPPVLEQDIDALLSMYDRIGHPFARVEIGDVSPSPDSGTAWLEVSIVIEEGPPV